MPLFSIAPVKEAPVVYEVLANIDLLFADSYTAGSLHKLAMLGAVIGLVVGCVRGIVTQKLDIHIVFITILMYMALMVPRVTVEVRDGSTSGPFIGAVQLPLGIAASASLFSTISDGLTRLYSDYVTTPSGWTISPSESWKMIDGMRQVVAPKVMDSKVNATVPYFADNIREYIKRCVVEDLGGTTASDAGARVNAILEGADVFAGIESNWGWRLATWVEAGGTANKKTCPDYYVALQAIWTTKGSWADFEKEAARMIVGNESLSAQVQMTNAHRTAVEDILNAGEDALEFMKKLYLQNHLVAQAGAGPSGMDTVKMLADAKYDTLLRSTADATLWSEVVWKYATLIWVLVIALLPFLAFLLFLGASGLKLFFTFVAALAWVSLWNPIATVLQSILAIAYTAAIEELFAGGSIEAGSMKAKMLYYNELAEWVSTGNYLMMSVPVIALFMLTGSSIAANSLIKNMNSESSIDTSNMVGRGGKVSEGNSAVFNQSNGMVGRGETGADSAINETLNIGDSISNSSSSAIEAARDAKNQASANYSTEHGIMADRTQTAARENAFIDAEQRDSSTSSNDQHSAAFSTTDGSGISSTARATAGVALQLGASQSIKSMVGFALGNKAYRNFMAKDVAGKGASLNNLSNRELNVLGTASAMETAKLKEWSDNVLSETGHAPTDNDYRMKTNEMRDAGAVSGRGPEADAERNRRNMLRTHGNTTSHQLNAGEGKSLAGGRLKGGKGGAMGSMMALAGAGYAIMPDIGVTGKAEAASHDEASRMVNTASELSETNLMNYSEEDMQAASNRWQEVMKSGYGFSIKDTDKVTNARAESQTASETLGEKVGRSTSANYTVGSTAALNRQTFMNRSQDLSREKLREIEGVGDLMDSDRGQTLLDRRNGGGVSEFAWQALNMAAGAGDTDMAANLLRATGGFDEGGIRSALGGASVAQLGNTIGDGKLTAKEFNSNDIELGGAAALQAKVESGSAGVRTEMDKANNFDSVGKAPMGQGVIIAAAQGEVADMPGYVASLKSQALAPVDDRTEQRQAANREKFTNENRATGDNWIEGANDIRVANGLTPISVETMSLMEDTKAGASRMIDRFINPEKASGDADQGAATLSMLEGAQSIIDNMDTSKLSPEQLTEYYELKGHVDQGIGEATASGAIGGIALPADGGNVGIGNLPAVTARVDAISNMDQYGEQARDAFSGLSAIASASGQENIVGNPAGADGDYMNAGTVVATHANRMRVNDAVNVEGALAAVMDGAADFIGADPQAVRDASGKVMDGVGQAIDAVGEEAMSLPEFMEQGGLPGIAGGALRDLIEGPQDGELSNEERMQKALNDNIMK